tara:strand:+ start:207 stop:392 length:186 start_codon:yes stop_codon:yes gene_type:complete
MYLVSTVIVVFIPATGSRTSNAFLLDRSQAPLPEKKKAVLPANAEETAHFPTTHSKAVKPW